MLACKSIPLLRPPQGHGTIIALSLNPHSHLRARAKEGEERCGKSEFEGRGVSSESGGGGVAAISSFGIFSFCFPPWPSSMGIALCPHSVVGHQPQGGPSDESFQEVRLLNNILQPPVSQQSA